MSNIAPAIALVFRHPELGAALFVRHPADRDSPGCPPRPTRHRRDPCREDRLTVIPAIGHLWAPLELRAERQVSVDIAPRVHEVPSAFIAASGLQSPLTGPPARDALLLERTWDGERKVLLGGRGRFNVLPCTWTNGAASPTLPRTRCGTSCAPGLRSGYARPRCSRTAGQRRAQKGIAMSGVPNKRLPPAAD